MIQCHFNHFSDAMSVDVMHAERLDVVVLKDLLLCSVDVAKTYVHQTRWEQLWPGGVSKPGEYIVDTFVPWQSGEKGDGHAVQVPRVRRNCGIDVGVRVDPDHACVGMLTALCMNREMNSKVTG